VALEGRPILAVTPALTEISREPCRPVTPEWWISSSRGVWTS